MGRLKTIYVDLDGVLVDFYGGVSRAVGTDPAAMYGPLNSDWHAISTVLSHETGELWDEERLLKLFADLGHNFWVGLEKYPWCDELYDMCRSVAPTVIMTSPARIASAASGKMQWIMENLPEADRFAITPCKHHMSHPGALLIDDSAGFCSSFEEHGGTAYLFPQPWSDPQGWGSREPLVEIRNLLNSMMAS